MNVRAAPLSAASVASRDIMGVAVAVLDQPGAVALVAARIAERKFTRVGFLNAHVSNLASNDPEFRDVLGRFLVLPDGAGVDIASKVLHGRAFPANLNGTDFVPALLQSLPGRLTVGLIGSTRGNIEAACDRFTRLVPQHTIVLISDGYFSSAAEARILADMETLRPDILLVAMGVPRQEFWIDGLTETHATIAMGVGALFDFISGATPRAPAWMRKARLEWLFRLIIEPRRLWHRYLVGNPLFLWHLVKWRLSGARQVP